MGEVERLKRENLELLEQREADQKHIDDLSESLVYNKNMYLETTEQLKLDLTSKLSNLESENKSLKDEIQHLRSSQDQISSIRQTLMEEKDMDILNLRVQLMSEKEQQLRELKTQMEREKDATSVKLQHEIQAIKDAFQTERQDLLEEMNQLQQLIDHLRIEVELKSHHVVSNTIFTQTDSDLVPRQDLDDYKSIVQELAGMFGINSLSEPLTIKTVIINYINDMDSKLDAQSRDLTTKTSQLNDLKNDMKALTKQTEQWELNHAATLQSLQQAHSTSLSTLKQSYDHQLATLTEKTASHIDPTTLKSWHDLETAFPTFFTAYKSEIQHLVETDTAALFQRVKESVDQEKQNLKAFFDRSLEVERVRLRERFDGDVAGAVRDVKEKCAVAYEEAVRKLKSEYVRLEQVCRRRVEEMGVEEGRLRGVVKEQEATNGALEISPQPSKQPKHAFASLCFGDSTVTGTLVLFAALKAVKSKGDLVAMTYNISASNLGNVFPFLTAPKPLNVLHNQKNSEPTE
ncbi:hypothetical protein HDU99_002693 [Rhizoclosmatium hyalinum]|nr:hypothetical protein HDU99_002693 [Rhizoclosmatium hyalinum]